MSDEETTILVDHLGNKIRLTMERQLHFLEHPEMNGQLSRIRETLSQPELVIETALDNTVHVNHRLYPTTPVTRKYMLVAVKMLDNDAFVRTAFFSSRQKKGTVIWQQ